MMNKLLLNYLFEASVALAVLYVVYELLLKRSLHFRFARVFILAAMALSVVLPWVELPMQQTMLPAIPGFVLSEATISPVAQTERSFWNLLTVPQLLVYVYGFGALIGLIRLCLQLFHLWQWKQRLRSEQKTGYQLIYTSGALPTFSFFRWLFWDDSEPLSEAEEKLVFAHEQTHMQQWHSADVLILEMFKIVFWFHPAIYAFQKSQRAVHEYLADQVAIQHNSSDIYLKLLTHSFLKKLNIQLVQSFYQSPLKNRMKMLQLSQTAKPTVWKAVASLALVLAIIALYACRTQDGIIPSGKALTEVDQMPVYEGGMETLSQHITQSIRYPASARKDVIQGEVVVAYTVSKQGTIKNVEIVKGVREDLDMEVKRTITTLKNNWIAGKKGNNVVDVRMTLPINFIIDGKKNKTGQASNATIVVVGHSPEDRYIDREDVFVAVEHMPEFPGGMEGLIKHLTENIKYPKTAMEKGIYGKVFISFIVREDGSLTDMEVVKGVDEELNSEALRVVKLMPKWIPGRQSGKEVPVRYSLPIAFSL